MLSQIRLSVDTLASLEIWLVGGFVAASVVVTRLLPLAVIVAALFWAARLVAEKRFSIRTPADGGVLLLALTIPVTLWASALPGTTVPQVLRLLAGVALYYAVVNWASSQGKLRLLLIGTTLAAVILAVFAPISVEWDYSRLLFIPRSIYEPFVLLVSDTVHKNVMAGNLVILLPLVFAWLLFAWNGLRWRSRVPLVFAVLLVSGMLLLTQSRGGIIAWGVALVLLAVLRWRWGWLVLVASLLVGAGIVLRFGIATVLDALATDVAITGVDGRVEIWSRAVYMIRDFSFTGVGMGLYGEVADLLYPFFLNAPGSVPHAHNLLLQIAVDLGVPGLIGWLTVWILVIVAAWQVYRRGREGDAGWIAGLGAGLLASQLALVVHGVVDAVTWGMVRPAPLVWLLWGLAVASKRLVVDAEERAASVS